MWQPGFETPSVKRKVFVSYHHRGDQQYYDTFSRTFSDNYHAVEDHSLDREVDSDNADYVMRAIRENYIFGSSCTLVLCGASTHGRKHVDWEIKATLDAQHALIGVCLPTAQFKDGLAIVPDRLFDNIRSGYALWIAWSALVNSPAYLSSCIELARGKPKALIVNGRVMRARNSLW